MANAVKVRPSYVVLRQVREGRFELVREVERRPGRPAKASRGDAVLDAVGREPADGEIHVGLPSSEWRLGFDW
jgi:hypothetical protein